MSSHHSLHGPYAASKAKQTQDRLLSNPEYCSLHTDIAPTINRNPGDQLRLHPTTDPATAAAYTIDHLHTDGPAIRLSKCAREKLEQTAPFDTYIAPTIPHATHTYTDAWEHNDITESLWDTGQDTLLCAAPHAGNIESNTAQAAAILRKQLGPTHASLWALHGFGPNAFDRWHITSTNITPTSYPKLATIATRQFTHAISFHVYNGHEILIGGLAPRDERDDLATTITDAIDDARPVITDHDDGKYMATSDQNLVNWLTHDNRSGIQIEMPSLIAQRYRKRLARATASHYQSKLNLD
jgi:phage replication-related protein YjqB (UPF0714/DUF867 family)